jgi:hypothetical protein
MCQQVALAWLLQGLKERFAVICLTELFSMLLLYACPSAATSKAGATVICANSWHKHKDWDGSAGLPRGPQYACAADKQIVHKTDEIKASGIIDSPLGTCGNNVLGIQRQMHAIVKVRSLALQHLQLQ